MVGGNNDADVRTMIELSPCMTSNLCFRPILDDYKRTGCEYDALCITSEPVLSRLKRRGTTSQEIEQNHVDLPAP